MLFGHRVFELHECAHRQVYSFPFYTWKHRYIEMYSDMKILAPSHEHVFLHPCRLSGTCLLTNSQTQRCTGTWKPRTTHAEASTRTHDALRSKSSQNPVSVIEHCI